MKAALNRMSTATGSPVTQVQGSAVQELQRQPNQPEPMLMQVEGLSRRHNSVDSKQPYRRQPPKSASVLPLEWSTAGCSQGSACQGSAANRSRAASLPLCDEAAPSHICSTTLVSQTSATNPRNPTPSSGTSWDQLQRRSNVQSDTGAKIPTSTLPPLSTQRQAPQSPRRLSHTLASYMLRATNLRDLPWKPAEQHGGMQGTDLPDATLQIGSPRTSTTPGRAIVVSQLDVMASDHASVTIFISDICGFTTWSGRVEPAKVGLTARFLAAACK